jgi:hypothetical protein
MAVLGAVGLGLLKHAALWYANDFQQGVEIPAGLSRPRNIREWFNDQQALLENSDPALMEGPAPVCCGWAIERSPELRRSWYQRLFGLKPPEPSKSVAVPDPEDTVASSYCYKLQTTSELTAEDSQCSKCDAASLRFERPDMFFD